MRYREADIEPGRVTRFWFDGDVVRLVSPHPVIDVELVLKQHHSVELLGLSGVREVQLEAREAPPR